MEQTYIKIGDALGYSVLGFAIVFTVLAVLIVLIKVIGLTAPKQQVATASASPAVTPAPAAAPAPAASSAGKVPAKGSLGELRLHTVDDRTAALLMAIVADQMDVPLNELRFTSIREVK